MHGLRKYICAARAFITTAYNVELGKCLFANGLYSDEREINFLAGLGQRDKRLQELATVSRTMVALSTRNHQLYKGVLDLLNRLQKVDKRIFEENNDDAYTETVHIILEWFSENHRPTVQLADVEV